MCLVNCIIARLFGEVPLIKENIRKLQLVQNFAARIISGKRKFDHISSTIKDLVGWLSVQDMLAYRDAQMVYKIINGSVPLYLKNFVKRRSDVHNRSTLSNNVRESTSLNTFKQSLKTWLFNA